MTAPTDRVQAAQQRLAEAQARLDAVMFAEATSRLAKSPNFPSAYLRGLALSGPLDIDARTVGDPLHVEFGRYDGDGQRQIGDRARQLHPRVIGAAAFLERAAGHLGSACQHLLHVVRELRVNLHKLAPSSSTDEGSVGGVAGGCGETAAAGDTSPSVSA